MISIFVNYCKFITWKYQLEQCKGLCLFYRDAYGSWLMSTDNCEGLTLTEVCIRKKKCTISSLDTARLGYASILLSKTGSDIPLHTTFTGISSVSQVCPFQMEAAYKFSIVLFFGFLSISKEIWCESFLKEFLQSTC